MYDYEKMKPIVFKEEMQEIFLAVRDKTHRLIDQSGAAKMSHIIEGFGGTDVWSLMVCVDRLKELEEIEEISQGMCIGQHRLFVRNK